MEVTILNTKTKLSFTRSEVREVHTGGKWIVLTFDGPEQQTYVNDTYGGNFKLESVEEDK